MSLYSGISFDTDKPAGAGVSSTPAVATGATGDDAVASGSSSSAAVVDEERKKNWSSALAFAPVRRPQANKVKPPKASAALFFTPTPGVASGSQPTDAVRSAAPVLRTLSAGEVGKGGSGSSTSSGPQPTVEQPTMRALPALTLESDSKKRPQPGPGGKVGGGGGGGGGKKKRKKGRPADNLPAFNPDEAYDPTKPNDIEAYLRWRTDQHRARERARKEREMRRQESATESSDGSYYSEDERDEAVKPSYKGGFAPPASYNEHATALPPAAPPPPFIPAPAQVVPADLTGDEAYARRVALSQGRAPPPPPSSVPMAPPAPALAAQRPAPTEPRAYEDPSVASSSIAASIQERIDAARNRAAAAASAAGLAVTPFVPSNHGGWETSSPGWNKHPPSQGTGWNAPSPAPTAYSSAPQSSDQPTDPRLASATTNPIISQLAAPQSTDPRRPQPAAASPHAHPLDAFGYPSGPPPPPPSASPSAWSGGATFQEAYYPPPLPPPLTLQPTAQSYTPQSAAYGAASAMHYAPPPLPPPQTTQYQAPSVGAAPPTEGSVPQLSVAEEFQRKLEEKRAAAAAIAARFARPPSFGGLIPGTNRTLVGSDSKPSEKQPSQEDDTRDFAVRMMEKWGHKEGQGLGVNAEGIVKPIEVLQTKPVKGKASGSINGSQPVRAPAAMGKVISESTVRKDAEDRARFGEPSRIITLEHMLGSVAELDDDLSAEIADECSQHGIVERVIVHERSPPPPRSEDAVVVFVVFSGPAGAWQALRALNDRFFSGRSVVAKYYPEARFARGERDL